MPIGPDVIGQVRASQYDEIEALLLAAFGRPDEAQLVRRLRADGYMWHEMVLSWEGVVAGYAALSRMRAPEGWACLAPLAVLPSFQHGAAAPDASLRKEYAVGTRLAAEIAATTKGSSADFGGGIGFPTTVVVVGEPDFYQRAGFSAARAQKLVSPYGISHTLIARPGEDVPTETLVYPGAFQDLS